MQNKIYKFNENFLFNTLNTIAGMALIENSDSTAKLTYALSDILRYRIRNSENIVELRTEIETIKKYLFIQKIRYSDKLTYNIALSDKVLSYKIPSMTLQPIIENSIIHGMEQKKDSVKIDISSELLKNGCAIVKINDNGIGMNNERLKDVMYSINAPSQSNIDLKIVQDKLIHYFGNDYKINIESVTNIGTTVYVKIPFIY